MGRGIAKPRRTSSHEFVIRHSKIVILTDGTRITVNQTIPEHSAHDLGRGLLRKILRDSKLTVEEFMKLV